MKIYGVGADIIKISRIKSSIKKNSFIRRIFDEKEILRCKKQNKSASCFAKRFAGKEAFSKAIGTGVRKGINFNEIVILNDKNGKPFIKLLGKTKLKIEKKFKKKKFKISLSLSDEDDYAVAFVNITI